MVELKLDTAAVNALFPDGTQARVDLQQAVINNIVTGILSKRIDEVLVKQIHTAVLDMGLETSLRQLVQSELNSYLEKRSWNSRNDVLTNVNKTAVKAAVEQEVKNLSASVFDDIVKECTDKAKETFSEGMKRKIDYALSNSESHFSARLNEKFKEILDQALAQRLGLAVKS